MEVYLKQKAKNLETGLEKARTMCTCRRKSFIGVRIVTPSEVYEYTWAQLDAELKKMKKD